jgi:hypothetical protein
MRLAQLKHFAALQLLSVKGDIGHTKGYERP